MPLRMRLGVDIGSVGLSDDFRRAGFFIQRGVRVSLQLTSSVGPAAMIRGCLQAPRGLLLAARHTALIGCLAKVSAML